MIDINKPVTNPSLVAVMDDLGKTPNNENNTRFVDELNKAHFLIPATIDPIPKADENGKITLTEGTTIQYPLISNSNNESFYIAFTDWDELRKWQNAPSQQTMVLTFKDYCDMVANNAECKGFVINPIGQNFIFDRGQIARLTGRSIPYSVKEDTKVMLGEPREYPHEMTNALIAYFKKHKEIRKAYLMLMVKGDDEQRFLFVIDFTGDRQTVFNSIASIATPHLKHGQFIDMVPASDSFGQNAIENRHPFYERKRFGFF